jgi:hypothetical protein
MAKLSITFDSHAPAATLVRIDDEVVGYIQKIQVTPNSTTIGFPAVGKLSAEGEQHVQSAIDRLNQFVSLKVVRE